jgi:flagellar assembly factor FliW
MENRAKEDLLVKTQETSLYNFSKGIPGFEEHLQFRIIDISDAPFSYLQSEVMPEISLLIADPFIFFPNYEFEIPASVEEELQLRTDFLVRCVVTLNEKIEQSTINLLAPLIMNTSNRCAKQVILHTTEFNSKHLLWDSSSLEKGGE